MADEPTPDPRAVLGVGPGASADEIHAAYRRLSRSAHPDAGGSDEEFRRVRKAYEALTGDTSPVGRDHQGGEHGDPGGSGGADAAARRGPETSAARRTTEPAVAPDRSSSPRSGCGVPILVAAGVIGLLGLVVLIVLAGSSNRQSANRSGGASTATAPPDTGPAAFARWRSDHEALVTAIVANGGDIGAALSGASGTVSVATLQAACSRRLRLLDELEAASPTPREEVTAAVTRFVTSEREAMAACLASPPDLDGLASAGARGQADLRTLVQATRE